jgi:hypothetical protein
MKTSTETEPKIITFKSADPNWPRFAISLPGADTEWFSSAEVRDTYANLMATRLRLPVVKK